MLSGEMSKNKKILFFGIFLAAVAAVLLLAPTKVAYAWSVGNALFWALNKLIYGVFLLLANVLKVAGQLFDYAIDPQSFVAVLKADAIYNGWKMVRDLFNIAFILVLLFSAFSTIFQVESFHIGKIWLRLVIIALLVNFSYPIALFIIDTSNVLMYYLLNAALPDGGSTSALFGKWSGITDAMIPRVGGAGSDINMNADNLTMKLLMAIVMLFVLMATLMTMAILLVVRIVVLAILVVLAPAGFVSSILPSTKKYSDDWWSNLFKYSFMGPTLALMVLLGLKLMMEIKDSDALIVLNQKAASGSSDAGDASYLASITFFAIPIVIMWSGMIVAQKLGVAGAGFAVKVGQGAAKKFSFYNAAKRQIDGFNAVRKERQAALSKNNLGTRIGKGIGTVTDAVRGYTYVLPGSKKARKRFGKHGQSDRKKNIKDKAEDINDSRQKIDITVSAASGGFNAAGNINDEVTEEQAASATAYMNKNSDEKKGFVEQHLASGGTSLNSILVSLPPAQLAALAAVRAGTHSEADLRKIMTHINSKMDEMANKYVTG